jgi:hypothetical protein
MQGQSGGEENNHGVLALQVVALWLFSFSLIACVLFTSIFLVSAFKKLQEDKPDDPKASLSRSTQDVSSWNPLTSHSAATRI